jgi:hypothetical protein
VCIYKIINVYICVCIYKIINVYMRVCIYKIINVYICVFTSRYDFIVFYFVPLINKQDYYDNNS